MVKYGRFVFQSFMKWFNIIKVQTVVGGNKVAIRIERRDIQKMYEPFIRETSTKYSEVKRDYADSNTIVYLQMKCSTTMAKTSQLAFVNRFFIWATLEL